MKKLLSLAFAGCFLSFQALGNEASEIDRRCYEKAFETSPQTLTERRFALNDYSRCMEAAINQELKKSLPEDKAKKMSAYLENMAENYQQFYWDLYNPGTSCEESGGSEKHLIHLHKYHQLLKSTLENVISAKK